jgi:hypothetical protein
MTKASRLLDRQIKKLGMAAAALPLAACSSGSVLLPVGEQK